MSQPFGYDRVRVYLLSPTGQTTEYLPGGYIMSFNFTSSSSSKNEHGFNVVPRATLITVGNVDFTFSWTQYVPEKDLDLDWETKLLTEPDTSLLVQPVHVVTALPNAKSRVITGVSFKGSDLNGPGQGQAMTYRYNFNALNAI